MRRHILKFSALLILFIVFLPACNANVKKTKSKMTEVLYLIHAASGHFQLQNGKDTQGQLILEDVNQSVAYFTDKYSKEAGSRSLSEFLSNWNKEPNEFSDNPPTAAFVYYRSTEQDNQERAFEQVNLKINHPQYNASTDEVIFDFQLVGQGVHLPLGDLVETTLFIDGKAWQTQSDSCDATSI